MEQPVPGSAWHHRRALGRAGEDLAAAWYVARGYELLARNWTCRRCEVDGEVDIVARLGSLHTFCEVKSRSSTGFGLPAEAVGRAKQARLRRLAVAWFAESAVAGGRGHRCGGPVRFDVACVLAGSLDVIEGAF
jgi:putative endonuclease